MKTDTRKSLLLLALDQAFSGKSWNGSTLRGSLRALTPELALWRPGPGRSRIWDYLLHCAYWKHTVRRRKSGWRHPEQLHGVVAHDCYHTGQIQLIKRLRATATRR